MRNSALFLVAGSLLTVGARTSVAQSIDLPTSKQLMEPVPGNPQRLNSLPMSMAISPDGRYVVTVNAGLGTYESHYEQSLAVLDTQGGSVADFPDARTPIHAKQTLYSGLAFSRDGSHLYASMGSLDDPLGTAAPSHGISDTGSGVVIYRFAGGKLEPERFIRLPLQQLAPGHKTKLIGDKEGDKGVPFPAAIALIGGRGAEKLLVAENLSDDVLLLDAATGAIEHRFDLAESDAVPSTYPIALQLSKDGRRAFVALWNASEIVELDLAKNVVGRKLTLLKPSSPIAPGTHPCAFALSPDGKTLYVALANRDAVAAVNVGAGQFSVKGYFDTRLPGQSYFGAEPEALALNDEREPPVRGQCNQRCHRGYRYRQADRQEREARHDRAHRVRSDGMDADVDGVSAVALRGNALRCHSERQGDRAEQDDSARRHSGREEDVAAQEADLHRNTALWLTGCA